MDFVMPNTFLSILRFNIMNVLNQCVSIHVIVLNSFDLNLARQTLRRHMKNWCLKLDSQTKML